jgi:hypothetical protein
LAGRLTQGAAAADRWIVRRDDAHEYSAGEVLIDRQRAQLIADVVRPVEAELGGSQDVE